MNIMIIAGEASGDLHGAGVVRAIKSRQPDAVVFGIGGDKMQAAGMDLVYHIREIAIMGFWEVLQHLPLIRSVERTMNSLLTLRRPDVVLLIDYPGFNLRFARRAKEKGIKVIYYISPQVWAWNPGRVKKMKGVVDRMLTVFPFEPEIYQKEGIPAEFVGHPLLEVIGEPQQRELFLKRYSLDPEKPVVGLFPGSRKQEIERIFPAMLGAARMLHTTSGAQILVGMASILELDFVQSFLRGDLPVQILQHTTHDLMANSDLAIVTSGTATLETGYFQTPMIVVYKTSRLTYALGRMLVKIKTIGLVNIVAGERVVPEMIQGDAVPDKIAAAASGMLSDKKRLKEISEKLSVIRQKLGTRGASERVADVVMGVASS